MLNRPLPIVPAFVVIGLLATGLAWKTYHPVTDPDTWWHLRVGAWVAEHRTVPDADPFSRMSRETPTKWVAYSWLYELGLYEFRTVTDVHHVVHLSRSFLVGLSGAAALGFVVWRFGFTGFGAIVSVAAVATLLPLTAERPWHFTIALTAVTLAAVTRLREGGAVQSWAWLPLVFVLWANLHIQFVLGWGVLGLACVFPGRAKRSHVIGLGGACILAVLVNPYHVRLFGVVWEYATQAQALQLVEELKPPRWSNPVAWVVVALLTVAFHLSVRGQNGFGVLLVMAGAFFSLRMQRDLWFGALAAAAVLGSGLPSRKTAVHSVLVVAGIFAASLAFLRIDPRADEADYPVRAAEYVRTHRPPGPLFNHFNWGGYLISELPEYPVSIDGRTNLYGNERVRRSYRSLTGAPDWEDDPDLVSANLAILPADCPLAGLMRGSKEWTVVYEDATAVVFRR